MAVKKKTTSLKALHEAQLYAQQQRDAAAIAFVVLAEAGTIDAVTASEQSLLFAEWAANANYTVGQLRQYGGKLYRCVQANTSQTGWEPPNARLPPGPSPATRQRNGRNGPSFWEPMTPMPPGPR